MSDFRDHPRSQLRTLVTILHEDPSGDPNPTPLKAWMEDISASGIQFASDVEIPVDRIWVRILLPELEDKLVECQIVRRGERPAQNLLGGGPKLLYGARFERIRRLDEFQTASPQPAATHAPAPAFA